ncbi:MAG: hypothetical protein EHM44_11925 [Ignavibacteriales bacterium]|nr:MAG: hypothetical protein EHM44_11925 [Ignavibacteriales bacterium]
MKLLKFFFIFFICAQISFPQEQIAEKHFSLNASIRTNFVNVSRSTVGLKLGLIYNLNNNIAFGFNSSFIPTRLGERTFIKSKEYDSFADEYYVTRVTDKERGFSVIPFDISVQYNFSISNLTPYVFAKSGYDLLINYYSFNQKVETFIESTGQIVSEQETQYKFNNPDVESDKNIWAFSLGFGAGIYIPISNYFLLDISYIYFKNSYINAVHSFGVGFKQTL